VNALEKQAEALNNMMGECDGEDEQMKLQMRLEKVYERLEGE
jgi:hypothetical protein